MAGYQSIEVDNFNHLLSLIAKPDAKNCNVADFVRFVQGVTVTVTEENIRFTFKSGLYAIAPNDKAT